MRLFDGKRWRLDRDSFGRGIVVAAFVGVGLVRSACALTTIPIGAGQPVMTGSVSSGFDVAGDVARAVGSPARTFALASDGATMLSVDSIVGAGPAGDLALTVTEAVGVDAAAAAIAGCVASIVCGAIAVVAATAVTYRLTRNNNDGTLIFDKGGPPGISNQAVYSWPNVPSLGTFSSSGAACSAYVAHFTAEQQPSNPGWSAQLVDCEDGGGKSLAVNFGGCVKGVCDGYDSLHATGQVAVQPVSACASIQGVTPPLGPDGKCPSGGGNLDVGLTPAMAAADLVAAGFTPSWPNAVAATQAAVGQGDVQTQAQVQVAGPASQTGVATTTTTTAVAADGTQTQTQTVTTPTYAYTYDGNHVAVTQGQTTTTSLPDGSSTTTTTTTPPVTSSAPAASGASPGLCDQYPTILACAKIGDPPTDTVPTSTLQVPQWITEPVDLPAQCPASTVTVKNYTVSWQPICDAATQMSPFVRIGAAFSALLIVIAAVRTI